MERVNNQVKYQKQAPIREAAKVGAKQAWDEKFGAIQIGDKIDIGGNALLTVIKKNRKTVVTEGSCKWDAAEIGEVIPKN